MNCSYRDIILKIEEPPRWWNEKAVPRFCDFTPDQVANIYADEAALVLIQCQACQFKFKVAFSWNLMQNVLHPDAPSLSQGIEHNGLWYGDPPAYFGFEDLEEHEQCCHSGACSTSEILAVLQFWVREDGDWRRDKSYERVLC